MKWLLFKLNSPGDGFSADSLKQGVTSTGWHPEMEELKTDTKLGLKSAYPSPRIQSAPTQIEAGKVLELKWSRNESGVCDLKVENTFQGTGFLFYGIESNEFKRVFLTAALYRFQIRFRGNDGKFSEWTPACFFKVTTPGNLQNQKVKAPAESMKNKNSKKNGIMR